MQLRKIRCRKVRKTRFKTEADRSRQENDDARKGIKNTQKIKLNERTTDRGFFCQIGYGVVVVGKW